MYLRFIGLLFRLGGFVGSAYMRAASKMDPMPVISTSVDARMTGQSPDDTIGTLGDTLTRPLAHSRHHLVQEVVHPRP
jgi:hypothetical protein